MKRNIWRWAFDFVQGITVDAQNGRVISHNAVEPLVVIFKVYWEVMTRNLFLMIYTQQKQISSAKNNLH